jgi:predicted TIM-barrel fold metal-dependent hydrolase
MKRSSDPFDLVEWAREISQSHQFWDFHAHPFCVLSGDTGYQMDKNVSGLYSKSDRIYHQPSFGHEIDSLNQSVAFSAGGLSKSALYLSSRLTYTFTGPKVFSDFIEEIEISGVMLLPVALQAGQAEEMLEAIGNIFADDDRFLFGCPLPVGVNPEDLYSFFTAAQEEWAISSIKIHPNILGIDPLSKEGGDILEKTLDAAGDLNLPIVIHGGRSPGIAPVEQQEYGTLSRLSAVDWSRSSSPVIIAHAGCYGLPEEEIDEAISILEKMLERYPNLLVDTSALDLTVLQKLMTSICRERFVFGSDSLYFSIWSSWITLLRVLNNVSSTPEDDLIQIASLNPQNCLIQ